MGSLWISPTRSVKKEEKKEVKKSNRDNLFIIFDGETSQFQMLDVMQIRFLKITFQNNRIHDYTRKTIKIFS